jgi:hypothetical protein
MTAQTGTLTDTVMQLLDSDRQTVISENDDGEVAGMPGQASFIAWTAPADGTYYVVVMGYQMHVGSYSLTVSDSVTTPPPLSFHGGTTVPARPPSAKTLSFKIR